VTAITFAACSVTLCPCRAVPTVINMNGRRITSLAAALTLAATPVAFGAGPPKGSHGQETDLPATGHVSILCDTGPALRTAQATVFTVPRGSHGQETDQPVGSRFVIRLACAGRSAIVLAAHSATFHPAAPKGSHGQETDGPRPHR
jgi:hypothetical protein